MATTTWLVRLTKARKGIDGNGREADMPANRRCYLLREDAIKAVEAGEAVMLSPGGIAELQTRRAAKGKPTVATMKTAVTAKEEAGGGNPFEAKTAVKGKA